MGRNRVKPEQASKVRMRMPTLRSFGEGRTRGEVIDTRTHAIRRGSGCGTSEGWFVVTGGDPSRTRVAASASHQVVVTAGGGRGREGRGGGGRRRANRAPPLRRVFRWRRAGELR